MQPLDDRPFPGQHHRRVDLMLVVGTVVVAIALVTSATLRGAEERLIAAAGPRVDEALIALALTLMVVSFVSVRRWREVRQQALALDAALQEVAAAEQWRADMMSTLAHDVRSPLTSIEGALRLLERRGDELPPEARDKVISAGLRQAARVRRLATGLLDMDQVDDGVLRLHREEVDLTEAIDRAVSLTSTSTHVEVEEGLTGYVDQERLDQVLVNLITNAQRHGAAPLVVTATASPDRNGVRIVVRDHGPGVPTAAQPHLFDRFSRSDVDPHSVGLGLWIAYRLVEAHGGTIHYEDADPGASFVILLPPDPAA